MRDVLERVLSASLFMLCTLWDIHLEEHSQRHNAKIITEKFSFSVVLAS
jgi:hypothetical protein